MVVVVTAVVDVVVVGAVVVDDVTGVALSR